MTLFHSYHAERPRRGEGRVMAKAVAWFGAAFKAIHHAIVAAKLRRLRSELMFRRNWAAPTEADAAKYPRRPLILGDKWDF
jgi:hypothetical protein